MVPDKHKVDKGNTKGARGSKLKKDDQIRKAYTLPVDEHICRRMPSASLQALELVLRDTKAV